MIKQSVFLSICNMHTKPFNIMLIKLGVEYGILFTLGRLRGNSCSFTSKISHYGHLVLLRMSKPEVIKRHISTVLGRGQRKKNPIEAVYDVWIIWVYIH